MRIYVTNPFTHIDAVAIQTRANHATCKSCDQRQYRVAREPAFTMEDGSLVSNVTLDGKIFMDKYAY